MEMDFCVVFCDITLHVIEIKTAICLLSLCVHIMKLFLSKMGFKEKLKQSSSNKSPDYSIDDKQICLSLVISNSQLYISHMPKYHCSIVLKHRVEQR
jgi:hypothetical protein